MKQTVCLKNMFSDWSCLVHFFCEYNLVSNSMPQCERISNIEIRNLVKDLFNMLTSEVLVLVTSSPFAEVSSHPLKVIFCEHTTNIT